jgi:hypothetical protein
VLPNQQSADRFELHVQVTERAKLEGTVMFVLATRVVWLDMIVGDYGVRH